MCLYIIVYLCFWICLGSLLPKYLWAHLHFSSIWQCGITKPCSCVAPFNRKAKDVEMNWPASRMECKCVLILFRIRELKRYSRYMGYVSPWISPSSISLQLRWMRVIVLILWLTEFAHICAKTVVSKVLPDFLSSVSCLVLSENAAAARWAGRLRVASPNWCIAKRESAHCRHAHSLAKHWHQIASNGSNWG